jgi:hypothetical protein
MYKQGPGHFTVANVPWWEGNGEGINLDMPPSRGRGPADAVQVVFLRTSPCMDPLNRLWMDGVLLHPRVPEAGRG